MADQKNQNRDKQPVKAASSSVTRRRFLGTGAAAVSAVAVATGPTIFVKKAAAADGLNILTWPGYEEKGVIEEFEDTHGVKVKFKTFLGEEQMLQFFHQTPRGTFDNLLFGPEYIRKVIALDAIEAVNPADFLELANYHPKFREMPQIQADGGMLWGIPTRFSFYGISYNTDRMSLEESQDWNSLFMPKFENSIGLFDWYLPNMGNASLAVHPNKANPYDLSEEQLMAVRDWLLKLRPQVNMFGPSFQPIVQAMINGDVAAAMAGDLEIDLKLAGYQNFESTIPKQGGLRWQENATLCKQSMNKDLALEWMKYMSQAHIQAKLAYTKAFKARAPNMRIAEHWTEEQNQLLGYYPDPDKPEQMFVETLLGRSIARDLPVRQSEKIWLDIFSEFKTS